MEMSDLISLWYKTWWDGLETWMQAMKLVSKQQLLIMTELANMYKDSLKIDSKIGVR